MQAEILRIAKTFAEIEAGQPDGPPPGGYFAPTRPNNYPYNS